MLSSGEGSVAEYAGRRAKAVASASSLGTLLLNNDSDLTINALRFNIGIENGPSDPLIAVGNGRDLVVLNAGSAEKLLTLSGHQTTIDHLVFSNDDRMLASADEGGIVKLWDLTTGQNKNTVNTGGKVSALRFAPGGQVLASAGEDKTISLWDVRTGGLQRKLKKHDAAVNAIAFSPDGQFLASGSDDRTVIIWEMATGKSKRTLKGHDLTVLSLAFSPDGSLIASGSGNASVVLWDVKTGKLNRVLR